MEPLWWWLAVASLVAVTVTVWDKACARHRRRRIPEATLFTVAVLGGAAAMLLTMWSIRHKTRHRRFMWGLPFILLLQGLAVASFLKMPLLLA
ncbi:MAG: DUF1294 domain-containing protein [Ruminococcaceae bacterium]|nr:DUF1294 domain-containing protein [Oscillospiraceae bacterium]